MDMITGDKSKEMQTEAVKERTSAKKAGTRKQPAKSRKKEGDVTANKTDKAERADAPRKQETKTPAVPKKREFPKPDPEKEACMDAVREAVMRVKMKPGARYRIETFVKEDETMAFAKVPYEFAGLIYTTLDISVFFKRSAIVCTHGGKKTYIMWFPVFEYIKGMVNGDTWLSVEERKKEESADAEKKEKRRWCM